MEFSDPRWSDLLGGYRVKYDPRNAFKNIEAGLEVEAAWAELWDQLHHQGDVGEASYASVTQIARLASKGVKLGWNAYALATIIEQCRKRSHNPKLPDWLIDGYDAAWDSLFASSLSALRNENDEISVASAIALIAQHKGQVYLSQLALMSEAERRDFFVESGLI